jgi:hypothetical protein
MTMKKHWLRALGLAFGVSLGGCYDSLLENPSFDLWCGESLCSWDLDEGSVERAPTWHRKDYGVSFAGNPTQISQATDDSASCLHFEVIADVDADARLTLAVDFDDDGELEWEERVPTSRWKTHELWVNTPEHEGFRVIVRKEGAGRAVLAQLSISDDGTCANFADDI